MEYSRKTPFMSSQLICRSQMGQVRLLHLLNLLHLLHLHKSLEQQQLVRWPVLAPSHCTWKVPRFLWMTGDSDAPEREMSDMWWRKTKNSKDATAGDIGSTISQYCFHMFSYSPLFYIYIYILYFINNTQTLVALCFWFTWPKTPPEWTSETTAGSIS